MDNLTPNPPDSLIARIIQAIIVATMWIVFMGTITGVLGFGILIILTEFELFHDLSFELLIYAIIAWLVWMLILWIKTFIATLSEERSK